MKTPLSPMLARAYQGQPPAGWLVSEKLDGVRAIWDGARLVSRNGVEFAAPGWFLAQLPPGVVLDGELWMGRDCFPATAGAVRRKVPRDGEWGRMRFCVVDAPRAEGGFEERLAFCAAALAGCAVAGVVPHRVCEGEADLAQLFGEICGAGGEGVMLRAAGSPYEEARSRFILKHKPLETEEAVVVGSEPGSGAAAGKVGALLLQWGAVIFRLGSGLSNALRREPPALGSLVSFRFCGMTDAGCPRFATFLAVRNYE